MIIGIGTDIVKVSRIQSFLGMGIGRIFSEDEQEYAGSKYFAERHYAGFWAAKEAYIKASGKTKMKLTDISVEHDINGAPRLRVRGVSSSSVLLSISHEDDYATAFVVIEK